LRQRDVMMAAFPGSRFKKAVAQPARLCGHSPAACATPRHLHFAPLLNCWARVSRPRPPRDRRSPGCVGAECGDLRSGRRRGQETRAEQAGRRRGHETRAEQRRGQETRAEQSFPGPSVSRAVSPLSRSSPGRIRSRRS
jgi:hypothetical protein